MSKYQKCKSNIKNTVSDKAYLLEAMKIAWKKVYGITLKDEDVEFHDEAVNLIGYTGDTRQDKANVIVRGSGVQSLSLEAKKNLKITGTNKMPGAYNDFGFLEEDGSFTGIRQDYQSDIVQKSIDTVFAAVTALKARDTLAAYLQVCPTGQISVNDEPVNINQFVEKVIELTLSGQPAKSKFVKPKGSTAGPGIKTFTKLADDSTSTKTKPHGSAEDPHKINELRYYL